MLELLLNPFVGQPPALLYSETAQTTTRNTLKTAAANARISNLRLRSICLTARSRTSPSPRFETPDSITGGGPSVICCTGMSPPFQGTGTSGGVRRVTSSAIRSSRQVGGDWYGLH